MLDKPPAGQHHYKFYARIPAALHIHATDEDAARARLAVLVMGGDVLDIDRDEDAEIAATCTLAEKDLQLTSIDGKDVPQPDEHDDEWTWDLREIVDGQGDIDTCGCGEPITEYDGTWIHIINPVLTGADDHDAAP
ncbi:hypothetical protein ACGFJC_47040 [Nonomuraea fuscirosea]|uniref:hypothetical protein n=1 Tax=Nonomuraea fuscirosea TaxID=1291556 RepID=UPI0037237CD0